MPVDAARHVPRADEARALLILLCRRRTPPAATDTAPTRAVALLDDDAERTTFLGIAAELRVRGLALARLERDGLPTELGERAVRELRAQLTAERRRAAAQVLEQERVLDRLQRAGITPLILKGAALRATLYLEAAEREVGDLDLLVHRREVDAACRVLEECGYGAPDADDAAAYARHHFHLRLRHPFGHLVEVHWALTEPEAPSCLDEVAFLSEARPAPSVRTPRRVPRMEHMLLHLASQSATDGYAPLRRLVDVDRIIASTPDLDWRRLLDDARTSGLRTALALTLTVARELLHTPVPGWARHELRPRGLVRRHLALLAPVPRALGTYHPGPTERRLGQLWVLAGDHGVRRVLAWLETQGYDGPVRRWRAERARTDGISRAVGKLKLAACQLVLHARGNPASTLARPASRLWRDGETAGAPRLASRRLARSLFRHRADAVPLALAFLLLPLTVARLRMARSPVVVRAPDGGAPAPPARPVRLARARRLARVVALAARHGVMSGNCLSRSLTLLDLMAREGLGGELRIGVRTGDVGIDAHAWVELDGRVLNDSADVDRHFAPLRDVRRTSSTRAP
jgi:hypothetical protein